MDDALEVVIELNEYTWSAFKKDLSDVTPEEVDWRPLPQANTINLIVRHLRIEALWHVLSLESGAGPRQVIQGADQPADSMPLDFERNLKELDELYARFVAVLRRTTLDGLRQRTVAAYRDSSPGRSLPPAHFLGFHQAVHLAMHWGQIRAIRNLYRTTRGDSARFFPDNPTFPS
jgi:DinB superfamily